MNNAERTQLVTDVTAAVLAVLEARDVAKPQPRKARTSRKAPQPKAAVKVRHLVKGNRREFVEAHAWAKGLSTLDIAIAVVWFDAPLTGAWAIGEGYAEKASTATAAAKRIVKAHLA